MLSSRDELAGAPAVYLDDFQSFLDQGLAAPEGSPDRGRWRFLSHRWGARKNTLLAGVEPNLPVLRFALAHSGWAEISIGCFSYAGPNCQAAYGAFVRLSDDPHWTPLVVSRGDPCYAELFFKTADIHGQWLEIAAFDALKVYLDYVKVVPCAKPRLPKRRKEIIGLYDFLMDVPFAKPGGREAAAGVRRHAEAGFTTVLWKCFAVYCEYPTAVGTPVRRTLREQRIREGVLPPDAPRRAKELSDVVREYDPLAQAVAEARAAGIRIIGWARISNECKHLLLAPETDFHIAHPHCRMLKKNGEPMPNISFAYPEARAHKTAILREIAAHGVDGVCIDVLRQPPMVAYDAPVVEAFARQTGADPRKMPGDGTEAWLRFRAGVFTQFLRETRAALDRQAGRRFPIWIRTLDLPWRNLKIGCDVEAWIRENLVDALILGPYCPDGSNYPDELDLRPFLELTRGRIPIYGKVWRNSSLLHAEALARQIYRQGADGVALYESDQAVMFSDFRRRVWRLAHPDILNGAEAP